MSRTMNWNSRLRVDASGRLHEDVPCAGCEYNLRGLIGSQRCPECGELVRFSTRRTRLMFADLRWLRTVRCGALLLGAAFMMPLAGVIAGALKLTLSPSTMELVLGVCAITSGIGWLLLCGGGWLITSREPGTDDALWLAFTARLALVAGTGMVAAWFTCLLQGDTQYAVAVTVMFVLTASAAVSLLCSQMVRLARRLDAPMIGRGMTAVSICAAVYPGAALLALMMHWRPVWTSLFALGIVVYGAALWLAAQFTSRFDHAWRSAKGRVAS